MKIQWFPGHMTKTLRMIDDAIKLVDGIIYVLDARAPFSSLNPEFSKRINNKPVVYILNKADLADERETKKWLNYFDSSLAVDSRNRAASKKVYQKAMDTLSEKIQRNQDKNVFKTMRFMVLGIPNSGKSTLINNLCGEKRANTGDKPGITRGKQWIKINEKMELLDTPGSLYPSFSDQEVAKRVAFIGSINDDILDVNSLAFELIKFLQLNYPKNLAERFNIELSSEPLENYDKICKSRGFLIKGGEFDYDRGGKAVIEDFRKGRLGKISLEKVEDVV